MKEKATFGGGCFWCTEAAFQTVDGISSVVSGYAGGESDNPSYRDVCSGKTGHAEVIQVTYNSEVVSYEKLLRIFFKIHNPETKNKEGPDVGSQYRSIILYHNDRQKQIAEDIINKLEEKEDMNIVTEVSKLESFYKAEEEHQDFYKKNPDDIYCNMHIPDKIDKVENMMS